MRKRIQTRTGRSRVRFQYAAKEMSNASRLVDKLLAKKLVRREECQEDRRRVDIFITEKGLEMLNQASDSIENVLNDKNQGLSSDEASELSNLLDKMRN